MPDKATHEKTFVMPTIWPEILIKMLIKKHPRLSFAKTKEILLGTPSIVVPESILQKFDLAFDLVKIIRSTSDAEPGSILSEVDLFFIALNMAWQDKARELESSKQNIINLYHNKGWIE